MKREGAKWKILWLTFTLIFLRIWTLGRQRGQTFQIVINPRKRYSICGLENKIPCQIVYWIKCLVRNLSRLYVKPNTEGAGVLFSVRSLAFWNEDEEKQGSHRAFRISWKSKCVLNNWCVDSKRLGSLERRSSSGRLAFSFYRGWQPRKRLKPAAENQSSMVYFEARSLTEEDRAELPSSSIATQQQPLSNQTKELSLILL